MIDEPGETPILPQRMVGPVLVTVDPAKTEKVSAVPSSWAFAITESPKLGAKTIVAFNVCFSNMTPLSSFNSYRRTNLERHHFLRLAIIHN